jgi:hypothetical protein
MHRPSVLVIGDRKHGEFRAALAWLYARADIQCVSTCAQAHQLLIEEGHAPLEWMIFAAARRGMFKQQDVSRLHRIAPLARLLHLVGSWCEGETRSGRPLSGVARVSWHQWSSRAAAELLGHPRERYAGWIPSLTSGFDGQRGSNRDLSPLVAAIQTDLRLNYESLAAALEACGYVAHWQRDAREPLPPEAAILLHDASSLNDRMLAQLRLSRAINHECPALLLLDAPRLQEVEMAKSLGIAGVVGKPFLLGDLRGQLRLIVKAAPRITAA